MEERGSDYTLEYLLGFNGLIHWLEHGYSLRFVIRKTRATPHRPHGIRYSFTLHDAKGKRILGFDNAHRIRPKGSRFSKSPAAMDHWHRRDGDKGEPYKFESADKLLADFFAEVHRILEERGISQDVVAVTRKGNDHDET